MVLPIDKDTICSYNTGTVALSTVPVFLFSKEEEIKKVEKVNLKEVMSGANGAERVKKYSVPMAEGMAFNYAAKQVDDNILEILGKLAEETQLVDKFAALYNGEMINTGEKRKVLHHLCRGQLGEKVVSDVPNVTPFETAHATAEAYPEPDVTSEKVP